jgi:hypothetical protein
MIAWTGHIWVTVGRQNLARSRRVGVEGTEEKQAAAYPQHLYICIKSGSSLVTGQKVWVFSNGTSYIAEDYMRQGEYVIKLGQVIDLRLYAAFLAQVV